MINIVRTTFNEKNEPTKNIYFVKINGDVPASHRMIQSELNAISESERLAKMMADRKRKEAKEAKKKAEEKERMEKMIAKKEAIVEEGKSMNSAKRKKFYHKKKVNNYVRHQ